MVTATLYRSSPPVRDYQVEVESARSLIEQMLFAKSGMPRPGLDRFVTDYYYEWQTNVVPCFKKGDMATASRRAWGIAHRYLAEPAILDFFTNGAQRAYGNVVSRLEGIKEFTSRVEEIRGALVDMEMALEDGDRQKAFKIARRVHASSMNFLHSDEVDEYFVREARKAAEAARAAREAERARRLADKRATSQALRAQCKGPTGSQGNRGPGHLGKRAAHDPHANGRRN